MKKLSVLFVAVLALGMSFVSCDKDDDNAGIEGKWYFSKIATTVGTVVTPEIDFDHSCNTKKDFIEFKTGGVAIGGYYDSECVLDQNTLTWSKSGNTLVIDNENVEILTLTNSTLKLKSLYTDLDETGFTVITLTR